MTPARKSVVLGLTLAGVVLLVSGRMADERSLMAMVAPSVSLLAFLIAGVAFLMSGAAPAEAGDVQKPAPRTLGRDPLNDPGSTAPLPERIEQAVELSKVHSRSVGLACLRLGDYDALSATHGARRVDEAITATAIAIQGRLRATDRALVNGRGEVLVVLPLIAVRRDLESVATRLTRTFQEAFVKAIGEPAGAAVTVDGGLSMYPIGGYRGDELIQTAQAECQAARAERIARLRPAAAAVASAAPQTPPKRPPRPRRPRRAAAEAPAQS